MLGSEATASFACLGCHQLHLKREWGTAIYRYIVLMVTARIAKEASTGGTASPIGVIADPNAASRWRRGGHLALGQRVDNSPFHIRQQGISLRDN